jgi:glycosyltransferase involved in cell wall biosynthesis
VKISVVTAVRNCRSTISDTLRSVAAQTYQPREHVVADGASTDGTLQVLEQHRHLIARLRSGPDRGIYDAFNKGLGLATGDVVGFLNADDLYEYPDALADVARVFGERDVDVVFGDVVVVKAADLNAVTRYYRSARFEPGRLSRGFMPAHPAMFVRRGVFERFGGFDDRYRIAGDFAWVARVLGAGRASFAYLPRVLVRMRQGGASTQGLRSTWRITREIRRACREAGIETSYARLLSRFPEKMLEFLRRPPSSG